MTMPSRPKTHHLLILVAAFGTLYALTAEWGFSANVDAVAAGIPAWSLATEGTLFVDEAASVNPWIVETDDGWVSNRPPGLIAVGVPAYLVTRPEVFTNGPATATAVVVTVLALVVLYITLCRVVGDRVALVATAVIGAGTSTWQISAEALWPHGPGQLWAAVAMLALSGAAFGGAGWMLALALLTRPLTAVSTFTVGISEAWQRRSIRPLIFIGLPVTLGLVALVIYNRVVFGGVSISGGYGSRFVDRLATQPVGDHLRNVVGYFLSPENGIFVWSPVTLVAAAGVFTVWRTLPDWARSGLLAGLAYILVHARLNRVSGGVPFGYRYPLEALILAAPALTLGAYALWNRSPMWRRVVLIAAGTSVLLQAALVFLLECEPAIAGQTTCRFTPIGRP